MEFKCPKLNNSEFGRPALAALSATFSQLEARKLALSATSAGLPNSLIYTYILYMLNKE